MHNSLNFIVPLSPGDREIIIQDVNSRRTFSINPWDVTFISVDKSVINVRTVGSDTLLTILFISTTDAIIALPKLQRAITELKDQVQTGLDQDTINYINNLFNQTSKYHHIQSVPSNIWTFTHNLNKRTSVSIMDSSGQEIIGLVNYIDDNSVRIEFNKAVSGDAWI